MLQEDFEVSYGILFSGFTRYFEIIRFAIIGDVDFSFRAVRNYITESIKI